ncbi:hypothetical protein HY478_02290 [Candidatus Uhrbacteria bacterium]|nr:hypothetical protein [Candidatus Uhrbacteria bacterium]
MGILLILRKEIELTPERLLELVDAGVTFSDVNQAYLKGVDAKGIVPIRLLEVYAMKNRAGALQEREASNLPNPRRAASAEELEETARAIEQFREQHRGEAR